jgi:hypothetical protein
MMYVDDGRTLAGTKKRADNDYAVTINVFQQSGFTVAVEKSDKLGDSVQRKEYLGFIKYTCNMTVHVPEQKLRRVLNILSDVLCRRRHKVRDVASLVGKLVSLEPALGRSILVGTHLATIAIVAVTDVSDADKKRGNLWNKFIDVDDDIFAALHDCDENRFV